MDDRRITMTFYSNTTPSKFGKGRDKLVEWICLCDNMNKAYFTTCQWCGIDKELVQLAHERKAPQATAGSGEGSGSTGTSRDPLQEGA